MRVLRWLLGISAVLALLFVSIGIIFPEISYENRIEVAASTAAAFAVLTDTSQMEHWMTGFKRMEPISDNPNDVGGQRRLTFEEEGREMEMVQEIIALEENQLFAYKLSNPVLDAAVRVSLKARDETTTEIIEQNTIVGKNSFWRSILYLYKSNMVRRGQINFGKLKNYLENTGPMTNNGGAE